ncbi:MAG: phage tail protein, partial [Methylobacterium sp.]
DHGVEGFDVSAVDGEIGGYLVGGLASVRGEIEDLLRLCGIEAWSEGGVLRFRSIDRARPVTLIDAVVADDERALVEIRRREAGETAEEILLGFSDPARAYQPATADAVLGTAAQPRQSTLELPVVMAEGEARQAAERLLRREGGEREVASFALAPTRLALAPGDWIELPDITGRWQIERIEDGEARRMEARRRMPGGAPLRSLPEPAMPRAPAPVFASRPVVHLLDLPDLGVFPDGEGARFAVSAVPWLPYELSVSAGASGFEARARAARPATVGRLAEPLEAGSPAVLDRSHSLVVDLVSGELSSATEPDLWGGANLAAVEGPGGTWEVVQFREAREIAPGRFAMTGLVRALGGTEDAMAAGGTGAGAGFVLLDGAVGALPLKAADAGAERSWLVVPSSRALDDDAVVRRVAVLGARRLRPLAPVHLAGRLSSAAGLTLRWIRRTRSTVEAWEGADVPLGEANEAYRVTIGEGRSDALVVEALAPKLALDAQTLRERFGALPERLTVAVSQISLTAGPGTAARIEVVRPL